MITVDEAVRNVRLQSYVVVAGAVAMTMLFALEHQALGWGQPSPKQQYGGVWVVTVVLTWLATTMWLVSLRRLAEAVVPGALHRRSTFWAGAGWVVPIVSLWFPYQVVSDLVRAFGARVRGLLVWWAAWLVAIELRLDGRWSEDAGLAWTSGPKGLQIAAWAVALAGWCWTVVETTRAAEEVAAVTPSSAGAAEPSVTP